jgi:hypothetical protein
MKLMQTILSKLRRSDLFVENRSTQGLQLRRSGIFRRCADVAPTELKNFLIAVSTKMPRLRRSETAWWTQTILSKLKACLKIARRFNAGIGFNLIPSPAGTAEAMRLIRSSLRDLNHFAMQPGVETPGYFHSPLWGWGTAQNYALLKPARIARTTRN